MMYELLTIPVLPRWKSEFG